MLLKIDGSPLSIQERDLSVIQNALPAYLLIAVGMKAQQAGYDFRADFFEHQRRHMAKVFQDIDELSQIRLSQRIDEAAHTLLREINSGDAVEVLFCICHWILKLVDERKLLDVQSQPVLYALLLTDEASDMGAETPYREKFIGRTSAEMFTRSLVLGIY